MSVEEGIFRTRDGVTLYTRTWHATGTPKARLVFIHGYADHSDAQGSFFPALAAAGITVFAFDQRGWGRSAATLADRGKSGGTEQIMEDITSFIKSLPLVQDQPLFLMGHSMGGNEVLYYAATGPAEVLTTLRGVISEAPFIEVAPKSKPIPGLVTVGRLASKILPNMQMVQPVDITLVSRDPQVVEQIKHDPYVFQTGTLRGLEAMLTRGQELNDGKTVIGEGKFEGGKTRLLILHGTKDDICWYDATKKFVERQLVQDKEFKSYEGWFHKLHDDGPASDKKRFADDISQWIHARL
ncbi:hypothetical protein AMS68_003328 [Peltaster fructicola]|uniref:Serine aminopeptidase S33 domain-containing protein n=1 Tax=Peltaster fructicola TaxID=286661 RepID=A0A6H0XT19_9PEZI|nr:hypothetical protein AMS68_003328 [Peltaster fructicola]